MTPEKRLQIYQYTMGYYDHARLVDSKLKELFEITSPYSHPPFIEKDQVEAITRLVEIIYGHLEYDCLCYWLYDCDAGKKVLSGQIEGTEYVFDSLEKYLEFVNAAI